MTLPLYLVPGEHLAHLGPGDVLTVAGPEGHHAATVRRTRVGERLRLADGSGRVVLGEVRRVAAGSLDVRVEEVAEEPAPSPRLVLVQALAKGDRDLLAVEAATELGVDEVVPWQAARSVVQWRGERGERAWRKWDAAVVAATQQSRRTRRPLLAPVVTTAELARRVAGGGTAYLLHEEAGQRLATRALPPAGDVLLVVGPEGGVGEEEAATLTAAGAVPVRLGDTVLRSSTAGPAALAVLSALSRWR
ncbi:MAG TPA: 16S rRNA (uracil(1498)-N(3))-methyltransferase [Dermatophilaceae bacterium]|nr:16S rRNA (uracil(1498)-N(3))-methyltransferase [Dermatophilaceae bacterium]